MGFRHHTVLSSGRVRGFVVRGVFARNVEELAFVKGQLIGALGLVTISGFDNFLRRLHLWPAAVAGVSRRCRPLVQHLHWHRLHMLDDIVTVLARRRYIRRRNPTVLLLPQLEVL